MARINIFQTTELFHFASTRQASAYVQTLRFQNVYIPGSLSFNNVAMIVSASGTTAKTLSLSFGLYSLNGSTLSLANSASASTAPTANSFFWITLGTSTTQDITPGNWYFAYLCSTSASAGTNMNLLVNDEGVVMVITTVHGGPFIRGSYSNTTNAFPESIATSDLSKETSYSDQIYPCILISS